MKETTLSTCAAYKRLFNIKGLGFLTFSYRERIKLALKNLCHMKVKLTLARCHSNQYGGKTRFMTYNKIKPTSSQPYF